MAITAKNNNLYPPTLPTYAETFIYDSEGGCKLFFSISKYNSIQFSTTEADTGNIYPVAQVVIYKQNTNVSVANKNNAPCEIFCKEIKKASDAEIEKYNLKDRKYYIQIRNGDLKEPFQINTYYRVQIRFVSTMIPASANYSENSKLNAAWLKEYEEYFSEWSTVSLIRGISKVGEIIINGMNESLDELRPNVWRSGEVEISGRLIFENPEEKDTLQSYYIKFFDENNNLVWDSGEIYNQSYDEVGVNEFHYTINKIFKDGETYFLKIGYTTRTLFSGYKQYQVLMLDAGMERLDVNFSSIEDTDNGRIILHIANNSQDVFNGNLIIRRTSGDSDFTVWEDVAVISVNNDVLNYTFYDYTIESGKWYRYGVQTKNNEGQRGLLTIYDKYLLVDFENIFLNGDGKQLCIRYDPQVSSFQKTVFENKVDTIGGKYPFVKRNGNAEYKQFPISGLITYYMNKYDSNSGWIDSISTTEPSRIESIHNPNSSEALFVKRSDLYSSEVSAEYDERNRDRGAISEIDMDRFSPWQDVNETIYEKDFRDKVMDFLYSNTVKLYRSATEGNILIKLMNISFTPNQVLGRKIWSFSATAYEIDEFSILNCDKYGIQTIGYAMDHFEYINNYLGQIEVNVPAQTDVVSTFLKPTYDKDVYHKEKYKSQINYLNYIRIEFLDKPYLINIFEDTPRPWDMSIDGVENVDKAIRGYLVNFDGKTIVVRNSNVYELKGEDIQIKAINFPVDSNILLHYELSLSQVPIEEKIISSFIYTKKISQLNKMFDLDENIVKDINIHFNVDDDNARDSNGSRYYEKLNSINGMRIEANEGTIVFLKESNEEFTQRHIIGPTESLDFWDPESVIIEVLFGGVHVVKASNYELERNILMNNRYIDMTENPDADVNKPVKNGIYIKNNKKQIWYKNTWYDCIESGEDAYDIQCPVTAVVDYYCELVRGYYYEPKS